MSWFLTKKKRSRKAKKPARKGWDRQRTVFYLRVVGVIAIVVSVGAGWAWAQRSLQRVVTTPEPAQAVRVELVDLPTWMPPAIADSIREGLALSISPDPFDRASLHRAVQTLTKSPWIKEVHRVTRRPGGVVEVDASYRRGVALVRTGAVCHLIDQELIRLPFTYRDSDALGTGLPVIVGVKTPTPGVGAKWLGDDLAAGLLLAGETVNRPWFTKIAAIDVSNHAGRVEPSRAHLKLLTAFDADNDPFNNPGVEWGRPPGDEQFYEPPTDWKLRRVAMEFSRHGSLDEHILRVTTEPGLTQRLASPESLVATTALRDD